MMSNFKWIYSDAYVNDGCLCMWINIFVSTPTIQQKMRMLHTIKKNDVLLLFLHIHTESHFAHSQFQAAHTHSEIPATILYIYFSFVYFFLCLVMQLNLVSCILIIINLF